MIFKLARARERRTRDFGAVRCIKGGVAFVVKDAKLKESLQKYFYKLSNGERIENPQRNEQRVVRGSIKENIKEVLRKLRTKNQLTKKYPYGNLEKSS